MTWGNEFIAGCGHAEKICIGKVLPFWDRPNTLSNKALAQIFYRTEKCGDGARIEALRTPA